MQRAIIILLALALDLSFGDPPNQLHPVVLMGNWLTKGRHVAPHRYRFWFGAGWVMVGLALFALPWFKISRSILFLHPFLLKSVFAYRDLRRSVVKIGKALTANDLQTARHLVGWHLVSRDTSQLTVEEIAGATIESLAENITDSVTAPLMAYAVGGLPAAWAYRFINTADTMWGYRTDEFEQLGKFPARLDDVINWLPARLTGCLIVAAAWGASEDAHRAARVMLDQHHRTSSPNAGWTMSAMAGALGITLGKCHAYDLVGGTSKPDVMAINRALKVADICIALIVTILVGLKIIKRGHECS